ncbi:isochorismatase family protein [Chloroflexota bacterium]
MKKKTTATSLKEVKQTKRKRDTLGGPFFWDIKPERTAIIVIDMQNCFVDPQGGLYSPAFKEQVPRINKIARECRGHGILVIWVKFVTRPDCLDAGYLLAITPESAFSSTMWHFEGTKGAELYPELDIKKEEDLIVTKNRYSAFIAGSSSLDRILRFMDKDTIIIVGGATNVCCGTTAKDAMMLDYKVIFVSDANAPNAPMRLPSMEQYDPDKVYEIELVTLSSFFAMVCTADELIAEIGKLPKKQ